MNKLDPNCFYHVENSEDVRLWTKKRSIDRFLDEDLVNLLGEFDVLRLEECMSDMKDIKNILGYYNSSYASLCEQIVVETQNKMFLHLNNKITEFSLEEHRNIVTLITNPINDVVRSALHIMYLLGKFKMNSIVRERYEQNFEAIKLFSKRIILPNKMNYDEWLLWQLEHKEKELDETINTIFLKSKIEKEDKILRKMGKWRPFRSKHEKTKQISKQQEYINQLKINSEQEKMSRKSEIENDISIIKRRIEKINL